MSRRSIQLIIAVIVVGLLIGGFYLAKNWPEKEREYDYEVIRLSDYPSADVTNVSITWGDDTLEFYKEDDNWHLVTSYDMNLQQNKVKQAPYRFSSLYADRRIEENVEDLSKYGLDSPVLSALVTLKDGSTTQYFVGDRASTGRAWYLMKEGDPTVYTIRDYNADDFFVRLDDLRDPQLFGFDPQNVVAYKLWQQGELMIDIRLEPGAGSFGAATSALMMYKPYRRRPAASDKFQEMIESMPNPFTVSAFIEDNPDSLFRYGLDNPEYSMSITDAKGRYTIQFGDVEDGLRYAKTPDAPGVFAIEAASLGFLDTDPFYLTDKFILIVNIEWVDSFELILDGTTYTAEIERKVSPEKDAEVEETFFLNGIEVEEKPFKQFYQTVIGLLADTENEGEQPISTNPDVTVTYYLNQGGVDSVGAHLYRVDRDFYAAYRDGVSEFLVSEYQVDKMRESVESLLSGDSEEE